MKSLKLLRTDVSLQRSSSQRNLSVSANTLRDATGRRGLDRIWYWKYRPHCPPKKLSLANESLLIAERYKSRFERLMSWLYLRQAVNQSMVFARYDWSPPLCGNQRRWLSLYRNDSSIAMKKLWHVWKTWFTVAELSNWSPKLACVSGQWKCAWFAVDD